MEFPVFHVNTASCSLVKLWGWEGEGGEGGGRGGGRGRGGMGEERVELLTVESCGELVAIRSEC